MSRALAGSFPVLAFCGGRVINKCPTAQPTRVRCTGLTGHLGGRKAAAKGTAAGVAAPPSVSAVKAPGWGAGGLGAGRRGGGSARSPSLSGGAPFSLGSPRIWLYSQGGSRAERPLRGLPGLHNSMFHFSFSPAFASFQDPSLFTERWQC